MNIKDACKDWVKEPSRDKDLKKATDNIRESRKYHKAFSERNISVGWGETRG